MKEFIDRLKLLYSKHKRYFFIIISAILFLALGLVLVNNIDLIIDGLEALQSADTKWVIFGYVIFFSGIPLVALILILLSYKKLEFWLTFKEQMALLFVNKVLPSGLGQLTLNSYYLLKEGNTPTQTASVIAAKALVASLAFMLMVLFFILVNYQLLVNMLGGIFEEINIDLSIFNILIVFGILSVIIWYLLRKSKIKSFLSRHINDLLIEISKYKNHPSKLVNSFVLSILATLTGMLALWASGKAVGIELNFSEVFLIYTFGNTMATLIPTPGGLGSGEIGLYAGFIFLGFDPATSLSAVLIYRIVSYWTPMIIGYAFFMNLRKNVLKSFSLKNNKQQAY